MPICPRCGKKLSTSQALEYHLQKLKLCTKQIIINDDIKSFCDINDIIVALDNYGNIKNVHNAILQRNIKNYMKNPHNFCIHMKMVILNVNLTFTVYKCNLIKSSATEHLLHLKYLWKLGFMPLFIYS